MRGFPLLNLLLALLFSGAVLWPLVHRATTAGPPAAAPETAGPAAAVPVVRSRVSIRLVHAAKSVSITGGPTLQHRWTPGPDELQMDESMDLPLSDLRTEFTVQIEWPDGVPETMAELRVVPEGLPERTANLWSSGSRLDEVVSLSWKGETP